jgi:hypothetical protein
MVPKVLEDFRRDFEALQFSARGRPNYVGLPDIYDEEDKRWCCGGLPVWQAAKFYDLRKEVWEIRQFAWLALAISFTVVAIPTGCAVALSWLTPTEGFGCRGMTQVSFLIMWVLSACIDYLLWACIVPKNTRSYDRISKTPNTTSQAKHTRRYLTIYRITFVKDFLFMTGTIVMLTWTALGMFNKVRVLVQVAEISRVCQLPTRRLYLPDHQV